MNAGAAERPFTVQPVAEFAGPWAMTFLPGRGYQALVTEKTGSVWLVGAGLTLLTQGIAAAAKSGAKASKRALEKASPLPR